MKKLIVISLILFTGIGFLSASTPKKKKVIKKSSAPVAAPQSTAKLEEVQSSKKPKMSASLQAWLNEMKKRVSHSTTKQNQLVAVAAVRGDETPDAPPLYWKGKKAEGKVELPELKDFETALDAATTDPTAGKEKLQAFLLAYPKSSLAPDVQETLGRLDAPTEQTQ